MLGHKRKSSLGCGCANAMSALHGSLLTCGHKSVSLWLKEVQDVCIWAFIWLHLDIHTLEMREKPHYLYLSLRSLGQSMGQHLRLSAAIPPPWPLFTLDVACARNARLHPKCLGPTVIFNNNMLHIINFFFQGVLIRISIFSRGQTSHSAFICCCCNWRRSRS